MSLVERALEKARSQADNRASRTTEEAHDENARSGAPAPDKASLFEAPVRGNVPRRSSAPQLEVTDAMLAEAGIQAPAASRGQQVAEYRHIKRQLLTELQRSRLAANRMIVVTSALTGDGKSYCAANLALSLALERDYVVLLVDADVIKPNLSRIFGLHGRPGLMDLCANPGVELDSLVLSTNIEGLSILPAGNPDAHATEHFASARMGDVIAELLAPLNRIIVFDLPPMLQTTEARSLVRHGGQIVLVVRAYKTPQNAVLEAVDLLSGYENVNLLFNAFERDKLSGYSGYGYQYSNENAE